MLCVLCVFKKSSVAMCLIVFAFVGVCVFALLCVYDILQLSSSFLNNLFSPERHAKGDSCGVNVGDCISP